MKLRDIKNKGRTGSKVRGMKEGKKKICPGKEGRCDEGREGNGKGQGQTRRKEKKWMGKTKGKKRRT